MNYISVALFFLILFSSADLQAREPIDGRFYWIGFKDKGDTCKVLLTPQSFLSSKALERREKFEIPINESDLPVNRDYLDSLRCRGVAVVGVSRWLNGALVSVEDESSIGRIDRLPFVKKEQRRRSSAKKMKSVKRVDCGRDSIPLSLVADSDTLHKEAFGPFEFLHGSRLHSRGFRGRGITIAVIDEGFYGADTHPAFDSLHVSGRLLGYRDFTEQDTPFFASERSNHGTMVLSCLVADNPGVQMGSAPEASYWLLSSELSSKESPLEEYYWVFAAEFADSVGVDVISSSLGYACFDNGRGSYSYDDFYRYKSPASKAASLAWKKGIVVVASAGNEGQSSWQYLLFPGEVPEIITVGSVNEKGKVSDFSSRGYKRRPVIKPDVVVPGERIYLANGADGYMYQKGTSFAAPLVSGLIACILQADPSLSNDEIKRLLIESALLSGKPNRCYGYGMPDFGKMLDAVRENTFPVREPK